MLLYYGDVMSNFINEIDYDFNALEPVLTVDAVALHYEKHHAGYAKNLNALIDSTSDFKNMDLKQIIAASRGVNDKVFNNAGQLFNHNFYWKSLKTHVHPRPGVFMDAIVAKFGSFDAFIREYIDFANGVFGSGWSWVVRNTRDSSISFLNTQNAENPIGREDLQPICVIDLWEHAYYVDYKNDRAGYINNIVTTGINWNACEEAFIIPQ